MMTRLIGKVSLLVTGLTILAAGTLGCYIILTPLPAPEKPRATEILDAEMKPVSRLYVENRVEIPVVQMPKHLLNALVAIEDDRFYQHHGLDMIGIGRALVHNIRAGKVLEGGSTLTQQLAKNLYLTHERTVWRKLKEAILTLKLEYRYTKTEILGLYWNTIYLGSGTYGVEVAAESYFGKPANQLTLAQSALLAALPRSPEYYSPRNNLDAATSRRNLVLNEMVKHGFISEVEAQTARAESVVLAKPNAGPTRAPYFVDLVMKELRERYPEVAKSVYYGGYQIVTTLDRQMQETAEDAILAEAPRATTDSHGVVQPQVSLVAIDPGTGQIRALVGGREQRVDRNRALEPHQPGSAFKPFIYAAALDTKRFSAASMQMDSEAQFPGLKDGETWRPQNYGNRYSNRSVTMREALQRSLNVVTVQWINAIKPSAVVQLARRMGIHRTIPENLTIGLGSAEVSPLELTEAYLPLANGGMAIEATAITQINDRNGDLVARREPRRQAALDPGVSFIVTDMLKDVLKPGGTGAATAHYLRGRPAAGKTGTSDGSRDAWFVGYTPDLVTGVWVGSDDRSESKREGGTVAAPIWANFMSRTLQNRPARDWVPPANVLSQEICLITGLLPNASCPVGREWFLAGTDPTAIDPTVHWDKLLPGLPGIPWAPPGSLPPGLGPVKPTSYPENGTP